MTTRAGRRSAVATPTLSLFAACAPGLEPLLAAEIAALAPTCTAIVAGGVELDGDLELLYRANLELGLALKILVRLARFEAKSFAALVHGAAAAPWAAWCAPGAAVAVRASAARSRLYHTGAIGERVRTAMAEHLGASVREADKDEPALVVHARLQDDQCTLSIDSSGESLTRRGYRLASGKAPLREDLARALVLLSGWDRRQPLIDPFCGAGTVLIEADWLARGVPPGQLRGFAFEAAPGFDAARFAAVRRRALAAVRPDGPPLAGSDRDPGAVANAMANAARAGSRVEVAEAALAVAPGLVPGRWPQRTLASNPPWGQRTGRDRTLLNLYQSLGQRLRTLPGWHGAIACADPGLAAAASLTSRLMSDAGGVKVYFCAGGGGGGTGAVGTSKPEGAAQSGKPDAGPAS